MTTSKEILDRVSRSTSLPALPASAMEVLRLTQSDGSSADDLAEVISHDPSLTAKLLKMVNSPLFGVRHEVSSVRQAVAMAGQRAVRVTALSVSLTDQINGQRSDGFDYETYWRSSLTTAVAGRLIALSTAADLVDEAFVAGLLSQIGRLAAHRVAPDLYRQAIEHHEQHGGRLRDAEREVLGVTGAQLGAALLGRWGLPNAIVAAVGACQGEGLLDLEAPVQRLARIVHGAVVTADLFCSEVAPAALDQVKTVVRQSAGLGETELESILSDLTSHVRQAASDLSLDIGATTEYSEIREQAAAELAMLSVQAEAERTVTETRVHEAEAESRRLNAEKKRIIEVASTDSLTQIPNRAAFEKRLDESLTAGRMNDRGIAVLMLDVDHFKRFNDTHGHQAGDEVLCAVAHAIRGACGGSAFAARWGGEEFTAVGEFSNESAARALAEKVRLAIEACRVSWDEQTLAVTASIGVAFAHPGRDAISGETLLARADERLYEAKHAGRNRIAPAA